MKTISQSKKWLLAGSVLFLAFACQPNSNQNQGNGNGKGCNPCQKVKKCRPAKQEKYQQGRCKDRPCGASDLFQTEENVSATDECAPEAAPASEVAEVQSEPLSVVVETVTEAVATLPVAAPAPVVAAPEAVVVPAPVVAAAPEVKVEEKAPETPPVAQ
ncbi:MAG TPA: hypothetical protein VLE89_02800 [Chlamydiales bacterium]|nr:hypothetical protein [Chlamydiales bacterium]